MENLAIIVDRMFGEADAPRIGIEAAHIYTDEEPGPQHIQGATLGGRYAQVLESLGCKVDKLLFVDNYNPQFKGRPEKLNMFGYLQMVTYAGFKPSKVHFEEDMIPMADALLGKLERLGKACYEDGIYHLQKGGIDLKDTKYHCALLDAVFTLQKLNAYDIAFNILPLEKETLAQQENMKKIVRAAGYDAERVINLYFKQNGGQLFADYSKGKPEHLNGNKHDNIRGVLGFLGTVSFYMKHIPIRLATSPQESSAKILRALPDLGASGTFKTGELHDY